MREAGQAKEELRRDVGSDIQSCLTPRELEYDMCHRDCPAQKQKLGSHTR